jgi:hypothetical protein
MAVATGAGADLGVLCCSTPGDDPMSEKQPQPTAVLIERLRRAARVFDGYAKDMRDGKPFRERKPEAWTAFANTCLQAAGRLDETS